MFKYFQKMRIRKTILIKNSISNKVKTKFIYLIMLLVIIFFSCNNSGDEFIGFWEGVHDDIRIIKSGSTYIIEIKKSYGVNEIYTGTYKQGNLYADTGFIIISYSNGKIIYKGEKYIEE